MLLVCLATDNLEGGRVYQSFKGSYIVLVPRSVPELSQVFKSEGADKVRSLLEHSYAILISFKIVVIFNITSVDFVLMSADVVLKMTTMLKEIRIAQLCSTSERTLTVLKEIQLCQVCACFYTKFHEIIQPQIRHLIFQLVVIKVHI